MTVRRLRNERAAAKVPLRKRANPDWRLLRLSLGQFIFQQFGFGLLLAQLQSVLIECLGATRARSADSSAMSSISSA